MQFQKCIDPKATIAISARLLDLPQDKVLESSTKVSIVPTGAKRQIPRPNQDHMSGKKQNVMHQRLKTNQSAMCSYNDNSSTFLDDDFGNMEDVGETCDEGQRPHEGVETINQRDTPLKRNALFSKQKTTHRGQTRRSSKNLSPKKKLHMTSATSSHATATFHERNSTQMTNNSLIIDKQTDGEEGVTSPAL